MCRLRCQAGGGSRGACVGPSSDANCLCLSSKFIYFSFCIIPLVSAYAKWCISPSFSVLTAFCLCARALHRLVVACVSVRHFLLLSLAIFPQSMSSALEFVFSIFFPVSFSVAAAQPPAGSCFPAFSSSDFSVSGEALLVAADGQLWPHCPLQEKGRHNFPTGAPGAPPSYRSRGGPVALPSGRARTHSRQRGAFCAAAARPAAARAFARRFLAAPAAAAAGTAAGGARGCGSRSRKDRGWLLLRDSAAPQSCSVVFAFAPYPRGHT